VTRFRQLSIRRKLIAMTMAVAAVVLLITSVGNLWSDTVRARQIAIEEVQAQVALLAEQAAVAVSFGDERASAEVVESFRYSRSARAACLYDVRGVLVKRYQLEGAAPCPDQPPADGEHFRADRLYLTMPVTFRDERFGTLHVRSDLTFLHQRLRDEILLVLGLLAIALVVALALSARLQSIIANPISALAATAGEISSRGDYSLRAARTTEDELGDLVDRFNEMVERVQLRESELSQANTDLRREIADRRRAEEERAALLVREREANRLKDEFLATLSHELRTPLNAILGWTKLLRTRAVPPEEIDRALEKVERNAQVQTRLVEDLLEVSRITSGKLRLEIRDVDLTALVGTSIETIRPTAEARGVTIAREFDATSMPTAGDPDRLQQVVWNLLSNAVKFTPAGGQVTVRLGRRGGEDELVVTDTGIGIAPEFLPHVFDSFRQADASATRSHGGLGLGLSIVRQLVEMHGGRVSAESPGPQRGASFTVHLPVRAVPDRQVLAPDAIVPGHPLAGRTIVVVDDDEDTRELVTSSVRRAGGTVVAAASVREGLGACLEHRPEVLISDIAMPGEDGYGLMRQLKAALGAEAPRVNVALTAFAGPRDRRRTSDAGFQVHLAKPFDPAELIDVISELLET
jgi:signal transduction histidine kinase